MSEFRGLDNSASKSSESVGVDVFGTLEGCNTKNNSRPSQVWNVAYK